MNKILSEFRNEIGDIAVAILTINSKECLICLPTHPISLKCLFTAHTYYALNYGAISMVMPLTIARPSVTLCKPLLLVAKVWCELEAHLCMHTPALVSADNPLGSLSSISLETLSIKACYVYLIEDSKRITWILPQVSHSLEVQIRLTLK